MDSYQRGFSIQVSMNSIIGDRFLKKFAGVIRHRNGCIPTDEMKSETDVREDRMVRSSGSENLDVQEKDALEIFEKMDEITSHSIKKTD